MSKSGSWKEEASVLSLGLRSPFWKLIRDRGEELLKISENKVRDPEEDNREFEAGRLVGLESVLDYPEERIKNLERMIRGEEKE